MIDYVDSLSELNKIIKNEDFYHALENTSLPFIPAFNHNFHTSKNKTVLIGQETAGWRSKNGMLLDLVLEKVRINEHIEDSKKRYLELYNQYPPKYPFLKLLNKLREKDELVQWLNFYICDYKGRSFNNLNTKKNSVDLYNLIKDFSVKNLVNQLNELHPKNMIFVGNYHNNWQQLKKEYAPKEEILDLKNKIDNFSLRFWNDRTLVIRMPHPASRVQNKHEIQKLAFHYYNLFNNESNQEVSKFKELIIFDKELIIFDLA